MTPRVLLIPWWLALPFALNMVLTIISSFLHYDDGKNAQITELATQVNNTEQALLRCVEAQSDLARSIDRNTDKIDSEY